MWSLVALGIIVLFGLVAIIWVAKLVFTPKEIYTKGRTPFGPVQRCRHCDAVVTQKNYREHGVNCPHRPR